MNLLLKYIKKEVYYIIIYTQCLDSLYLLFVLLANNSIFQLFTVKMLYQL